MATTGRCHCGAISYVAAGPPDHHALCHCDDCRRWSGAPMSGWIAWPEDRVTISGTPVRYRSSTSGSREFCGACGTGLFYRNAAVVPGMVDVQTATLDDPETLPPMLQSQLAERLDWMTHVDELPGFERCPGV